VFPDSDIHVFAGKIYRLGPIRYVDVPADISKALGQGAPHVPVGGEVQGVPIRTTMVSRGKGAYRLALHSEIRKKLKIDAGAVVELAIYRDQESREPQLPPALVFALRNAPKAQREFRHMTTSLRRQIVRYLTSVKQQATLERRAAALIRRLEQNNSARTKHNKKRKP
jgi:Domain of unknown function (DUF1905)/Bacteriocin-protection, YdeI or OmpD-Associated